MDSDDNCLVIDESIADMEVSSTSETRAAKDVCEIKNHNENEADSTVANIISEMAESTTPLNLSTKKTTQPDDGHGHAKEKGKDKEKERHREKTRSKDERRKSATPSNSEKHRGLNKRTNCIRLTEAVFKDKILNVS